MVLSDLEARRSIESATDLKKLAGSGQCVAFGARYQALGTLRKSKEPPKKPDTYPVAEGLVKVDASNPQARALRADFSQ